MPLTIIRPRLISVGVNDHNLGNTHEEQVNNGVLNPDPPPFSASGFLLPDGSRRPYQPGDRVSSPYNPSTFAGRLQLIDRLGERYPYNPTTGLNTQLVTGDGEYQVIEAQSVYVFRADDGTGYIKRTTDSSGEAGTFVPSTPQQPRRRADPLGIALPDPDVEQDQRDDKYQPDPLNPYWTYERRINRLSFTDERPTHRTGRFDDPSGQGLLIHINAEDVGDAAALIGIEASEISWGFTRGGTPYGDEFPLDDLATVQTWFQYFFNDISFPRHFLIPNLPTFNHRRSLEQGQRLFIRLRNPGAVASVGQVVFGSRIDIGANVLASGYTIKSLDFSTVGTDEFGVQFRTVRPSSTRNTYAVEIQRDEAEAENRKLEGVSGGRPAVFVQVGLSPNSAGGYDSSYGELQYGYRKEYTIAPIANKSKKSLVSGSIDSLI